MKLTLFIVLCIFSAQSFAQTSTVKVSDSDELYGGILGLDCTNSSPQSLEHFPLLNSSDFAYQQRVGHENVCRNGGCHEVQDCRVWIKATSAKYKFRSTQFWKQTRNVDELPCQKWVDAFSRPQKVIISSGTSWDDTGCYGGVTEIIKR